MKLVITALFALLLLNGTTVFADAEIIEATQEVDILSFFDYAWRIAVGIGAASTIIASQAAKRFVKGLTFDNITDLSIAVIEKLSKSPDKLTAIIVGLSKVPAVKKAFEDGKQVLLSRLNQIEQALIDERIKLNSGILSEDDEKLILELMGKLQSEKVRLLELYASKTS